MTLCDPDPCPAPLASRIAVAQRFAADAEAALSLSAGAIGGLLDASLGSARGGPGRSGLNHDETPLQLVLSLTPSGRRLRVLLDPALGAADPAARFAAARADARAAVQAAGGLPATALLERVLAATGPDADTPPDRFDRGVLWRACELGGSGAAVYVDASARPGGPAWGRVASLLPAPPSPAASVLAGLRTLARPASVGLEAKGAGLRLKLHARLVAPPAEGALARALPVLACPRTIAAIGVLMGRGPGLTLHGFVLEAAFDPSSGRVSDGKADIAMPGLCDTPTAFDRAAEAAGLLGLDWPTDIGALRRFARLAFVGVGRAVSGAPRLNLYLKPAGAAG